MACPTASYLVGLADFTTVNVGALLAPTLALSEPDTAALAGSLPFAVAVFPTEPLSTSACVTAYVPVQVIATPGSSEAGVAGVQSSAGRWGSLTVTAVRVVFPVFVAVIV